MAPIRARFFIRFRSTNGESERRSTYTNAIAATIETKNEPSVSGEVHPHSDPLLTATMNGARIAATRKVPSQSMLRERFGSKDSSTRRRVIGTQRAAIPASIQNSACHPAVSTRTPPTSGPAAAPIAEAAPQRDSSEALRPGGGNREQTQATSQDRRARRPLYGVAADDTGGSVGHGDQGTGDDEQGQAAEKDAAAAKHVAESASRDDERRPTNE